MESELKSERLEYRLVENKDYDALREIVTDSDVTEPAGYKALTDDVALKIFLSNIVGKGISIIYNGNVIGYCRVASYELEQEPFVNRRCVEIGFIIGKKYQRQGFGYEMLRYITTLLKVKYDYVFADAFVDNVASNNLIKKCGFKYLEDYTMMFDSLEREMTCHSYYL